MIAELKKPRNFTKVKDTPSGKQTGRIRVLIIGRQQILQYLYVDPDGEVFWAPIEVEYMDDPMDHTVILETDE